MKLHLPRLLAAAVLASLVAVPAYTAEIPDEYKDNTVLVRDADYLADYASNASTDYVAFLLDMDIEVPSDISLSGGNLYFTSRNAQLPVSLEYTGSNSSALTNQSSLVFDTLSGLSFASYKKGAISTSGNLIIQNVNDGVEDSENPDVFFSGNTFSFSSSYSYYGGGAIYASGDVNIIGNGDVTFMGNSASSSSVSYGGAIYASGDVSISGNGDVCFTGNSASSSPDMPSSEGGAIFTRYGDVIISGNGDVSFTGNTVSSFSPYDDGSHSYGGAIYAEGVSISGNGDVTFTGNSASSSSSASFYSNGGAIYASGDVSISGNGDVCFTGNSASSSACYSLGGAICASGVSISGNGDVLFTGNSVSSSSSSSYESCGGAICASRGGVSISGSGDVLFTGNSASSSYYSYGGAIRSEFGNVSISGNGDVLFTGNSASSSDVRYFACSSGGAICASGVSISGNGDVSFMGNSASSYASTYASSYAFGGAIHAPSVSITGNGDVLFTGNYAFSSSSSSYYGGGAIYASSGGVTITGNETVCFEKNYERENSTYRLRSIYTGGALNLSAKTGGHITFHDSVYCDGGTTALNADYTDAEGKTQQAKGTIIFSGQYTKTHLDDILEENNEGRVATDAEILNSRTSTLGDTTLYGGTLQVLDGAILDTASLSVEAGSSASVLLRDAELKGTAGITFNAGTTLLVQGDSLITGDVLLLAGSSLDIDGAIIINGGLTLGLGLTLSGDILADIRNLQAGQSLTLVSGLESLAVQTQNLMRSVEYTTVMDGYEVQAYAYFSNLAGNTGLVMRYDSEAGTVSICNTPAVPEPTTATLSLLAFAALAARRRRK